jgi:hypothetical protein
MTRKFIWMAAMACGAAGLCMTTTAQAQYYYGQPRTQYYYEQPAPPYVSPRVARKQAQLEQRFVDKYGYQQPYYYPAQRPYPQQYQYQQPRAYQQRPGWSGYQQYGQPAPYSGSDAGAR